MTKTGNKPAVEKKEARGIRNCNPCNIRRNKSQWMGMRPVQTDAKFVQFVSKLYAYRAVYYLIMKRYILKGHDTIGKIITRWAPSRDGNNTQSYINHVCQTTGIPADFQLNIDMKKELVDIVMSMTHIESGYIEDRDVIEKAYDWMRSDIQLSIIN